MLDELWTGEFRSNVSNINVGHATVIFHNGWFYGGGSVVYLTGTYEETENHLIGDMTATHIAGDPITLLGLTEPHNASKFHLK